MALLPEAERKRWLESQPEHVVDEILRGEWWWVARPEQIPPDGEWFVCLALAGRGFGKTRAGAEWVVERALRNPVDTSYTPTEWLVIAETLSDARTICMEGPAGILQVLNRRKVKYRYKMSPRPMVLFPNGSKIYTEGADDPDVGRGYNAAGAWLDEICVAENEPVLTSNGSVPVQDIRPGDLVMTRAGWASVTAAGLTASAADIVELQTETGAVRVTPSHRVWTERGWVMAQDVRSGDIMWRCQPTTNTVTPYQVKHQPSMSGTARLGTSTREWGITSTVLVRCCTGASGQNFTDRYRMGTRSTISTVKGGIIDQRTWRFSHNRYTGSLVSSSEMTRRGSTTCPLKQHRNDFVVTGNDESLATLPVLSAVLSSSVQECGPSSAQPSVGSKMHVERIRTRVTAVVKVPGKVPVYDITVSGSHPEFAAGNGNLLVHNCKWKYPKAAWYEGIMPSLRADLINDHPRAFVTTTPKPLDILQEWVSRGDSTVHIIRGSTFDNKMNLSPQVIAELKLRYEGTAIGLQELYGEILEAFEGALFSRLDMENHRVYELPDDIVATVVGVDPSLTGEDDEMGIVVVSRDRDKHLYVQADRSVMAVGRAAALEAWRIVAEFGADKLVVEENLGKKWMQQVFNDAYVELVGQGVFPEHTKPPLVRVDAKLGKKTRGEPVAMRSEQGRLHLVGKMPELEDQMTTFTSWGTRESPDRLDALVHACRFLMDGEKKETRIATPATALSTTLQDLLSAEGSYYSYDGY